MTDIIASPAVKEAVKIVMEQQERLGKNAAEAVSAATTVSAATVICTIEKYINNIIMFHSRNIINSLYKS